MPRLAFLVDACVDIRLARWLNDQGHDASHLREEGLQSLPNGRIFAKAIDEGESWLRTTLILARSAPSRTARRQA
jgi:predicted nuclease of predicted toxin-antitoxin system